MAGKAGNGRGILAEGSVGTGDRVSFDGMIQRVALVEVQVCPGIHFLVGDGGAPGESDRVCFAVHFHLTSDMASHAHVLGSCVEVRREITRVG